MSGAVIPHKCLAGLLPAGKEFHLQRFLEVSGRTGDAAVCQGVGVGVADGSGVGPGLAVGSGVGVGVALGCGVG